LVIAIDKETSAAVIIAVKFEDLPKVTSEFRGIRHFREVRRNRNEYLLEEFKPKLEKARRKYPIEIKFYAKVDHYFWEDVEYYAQWGLEIIVDDHLWEGVLNKFGDMQISILKEGDIKPTIEELKQKLWKAQKKKDVITQQVVEQKLEFYRQRYILITIADNYIHLKKRGV